MPDSQVSPISQLLYTLGITREDLNKRSDQMRQFLTAESDASSRVSERDTANKSRSGSDIRSVSMASTSTTSFTRSLSRARSDSLRDVSPPATPIKCEPTESSGTSLRHYDSMEMVIERQRQSRKEKKSRRGKERESSSRSNMPHPPSPSPSNASQSSHGRDYRMYPRDERCVSSTGSGEFSKSASVEKQEPLPVTPQKNKYYRDHTLFSGTSQPRKETPCKVETSTPSRPSTQVTPRTQSIPQYYPHPQYSAYAQYLPPAYNSAQASSSAPPVTPQVQRIQASAKKSAPMSSPLPPSSPPPASSPFSSPIRPALNLVSSPGPMGPLPTEEDYDSLPYTLPPGPYSPNKPDSSYAALVGQAILSSPEHRLTLQEIYDWITIVYPHYKRGETTWMNSIRHVLSTTVCFRKVPRERSIGRTLWAIFDEDLECFKGGGFRKQLCKDIANGNDGKDRQANGSKGKSRVRKRPDDDDGAPDSRKTKKSKKEQLASSKAPTPAAASSSYVMPATLGSHPLFPPTRPTPHHQPYYESCLPQPQHPLPAEIIFPPLPAGAAFSKVLASTNRSVSSASACNENEDAPNSSPLTERFVPPTESASMMSVPDLTPNRSSSPPSSLPSTSDMDIDLHGSGTARIHNIVASVTVSGLDDDLDLSSASGETEDGDDNVFNTTLLGPVKFWGESPKAAGILQPGIQLMDSADSDEDTQGNTGKKDVKGKKKQMGLPFPPMPSSPTFGRRAALSKAAEVSTEPRHPTTPTPMASNMMPSTPPRKMQELPMSSVRTPISHKGLHMSPSASLAHYKSNLDPPPALVFNPPQGHEQGNETRADNSAADPLRTPRKRTTSGGTSVQQPVTPRKLVFHANASDSPFRTPVGGGSGSSPFRTPRSRAIFDPHDPRNVLNEELNRMGEGYGYGDSPGGLFGKSRESLLYDSPGLDSPGKWQRWW